LGNIRRAAEEGGGRDAGGGGGEGRVSASSGGDLCSEYDGRYMVTSEEGINGEDYETLFVSLILPCVTAELLTERRDDVLLTAV
jgi:hypothetical protein